jgi:hypothetical protein
MLFTVVGIFVALVVRVGKTDGATDGASESTDVMSPHGASEGIDDGRVALSMVGATVGNTDGMYASTSITISTAGVVSSGGATDFAITGEQISLPASDHHCAPQGIHL